MHVSHVCLSNLNRSRSAAYPYLYQGMNSSCATVNPLQIATNPRELIQEQPLFLNSEAFIEPAPHETVLGAGGISSIVYLSNLNLTR